MLLRSPAVVSMSSLPLLLEGEAELVVVAVLVCLSSVVSTLSLLSKGELVLMSTLTSLLLDGESVVVLVCMVASMSMSAVTEEALVVVPVMSMSLQSV